MTDTQPKSDDCRTAVELALWRALQIARKERDEARRYCCELWSGDVKPKNTKMSAEDYADSLSWDCFKENP